MNKACLLRLTPKLSRKTFQIVAQPHVNQIREITEKLVPISRNTSDVAHVKVKKNWAE